MESRGLGDVYKRQVLFMKSTVASQFASEQVMLERLDSIVKQVETLPPPKSFVPIMSDIGWRQFLSLKGRLSAVVDLETYAIGPREVELVLLEAMLTAESVQEFVAGYSSHMQLPSLAELREVYRFFCHVVGAPGVAVLEDWEKYPPLLEFGV